MPTAKPRHDLEKTGVTPAHPTAPPLTCRLALLVLAAFLFSALSLRAQNITYTTIDPPGSFYTMVTGVSGNNVVGEGAGTGFLYNNGTYKILNFPLDGNPVSTSPTAVSGTNVVGSYSDGTMNHGFLYNGSIYTTIDPPGSVETGCTGVDGNNVVGSYYDSSYNYHGFLYNNGVYTILDAPGSTYTDVSGVSGNNVVGWYQAPSSATNNAFLYNGGNYTQVIVPTGLGSLPTSNPYYNTVATAVSGDVVVGTYAATNGAGYGFIYNNGGYTTLQAPGTVLSNGIAPTMVTGVSGNNVVGSFGNDSGNFSFLYNTSGYTILTDPSAAASTAGGTYATGVSGQNVAGYYIDSGGKTHGFLAAVGANSTDPFNGTSLGGGWNYSSWFGTYNSTYYPWIYRTDIGFMYVDTTDNINLYLYVLNGNPAPLGWLYTSQAVFPNVYSFTKASWLYFFVGGTSFYNWTSGQFETY